MWKRILYVVFVLFCVELGLFLLVLPWSELWDRNALFAYVPSLRPVLINNFVRGALSGLGLLNLWVAASDIWHFRSNMAEIDRQEAEWARGAASAAGTALPEGREDNDRTSNPVLHN